jgi:Protein of unknown function (DUF3034)
MAANAGDRLEWTGAVTQVEGAAGGGLVPWALIGGLGTNAEVGASAFVTYVPTQDFVLRAAGASVDVDNRVEISAARQRFDATGRLHFCVAGLLMRSRLLYAASCPPYASIKFP